MRILTDEQILSMLRCPICHAGMMTVPTGSLVCTGARRHCFDFGASGYVNLSAPGQSGGGDSKAAVRARSRFLDGQWYRPVADGLAQALEDYASTPTQHTVIDAGCGEGYYSERIASLGYHTVGVDLSKFAVDAAAKRARAVSCDHSFYAVAGVYDMPFADASASAVINVFAPCAEEEYTRVLKDGGVLIVAHAGEQHLMGLKRILYDTPNENGLRADLPKHMTLLEQRRVLYTVNVEGREAIEDLFSMTPYYWRTSIEDANRLAGLDVLQTEVDVLLSNYRKTEGSGKA